MSTSPGFSNAGGARTATAWRLGIGSYALRWGVELRRLTPLAVIELAAQMGAQALQLQDNLPVESLPPAQLERLAARAAELGVRLELGIRGSHPEQLYRALLASRALGASLLRVVISAPGWSPSAAELEAILRALLPDLRRHQVALALENHFDLRPQELARLVQQIDDPQVGVCLDPFNSVASLDGPQETIRCLAPYALSVHLKDVQVERLNTGFHVHGCPMGAGLLDVPYLLGELRAAGRFPALFLEAWMDRQEDEEVTCAQEEQWARSGLEFLRQMFIHNKEI